MNQKLKEFSNNLAKEIAERTIIDINDISVLIEIRIKSSIVDFIEEYSTKEEKEYLKLLTEQSKNKIGSPQYNQTAFKLTAAKAKKATANRAINNIKRESNFKKLKTYVALKYGSDALNDFVDESK